jgi:hypothetical protein
VPEITDEFMREMLGRTAEFTAVVLRDGPNASAANRDELVWEHGRRNFELRAAGTLAIVCPVMDDTDVCGIGIFTTDPEATRRVMDADPGVQAGVFVDEVHPVRSFPGDALPS